MNATFQVNVPPTTEQGSAHFYAHGSKYEPMTKNALSTYNSMRAHDGLPPVPRMPNGTKYTRLVQPYLNPKTIEAARKDPTV